MADLVSPLAGVVLPGTYGRIIDEIAGPGVHLGHRICTSLVQVKAWPNTLENVTKTLEKLTGLSVRDGAPANDDFTILPTGPGRFLIESQDTALEQSLRKAVPPEKGAVTGLSHARVVVCISGPKAEWVLSKGIAVDFSLAAFPVATALVTSHHEIGLTIRRVDGQSFDLYLFTSFARSFWAWLEKAAGDVGFEVS